MKIYVASSWRNEVQEVLVNALRKDGHDVYDFKNPPGKTGFQWSSIDPNWKSWSSQQYLNALSHPIAEKGFESDFDAMKWADVCVLLLPCGRSAHTEAGWMKGMGKSVYVLLMNEQEPELMYKIYDNVYTDPGQLLKTLKNHQS